MKFPRRVVCQDPKRKKLNLLSVKELYLHLEVTIRKD